MREHVLTITKKDLVRQTFRAGGKGGQKQNVTETGVRFIHPPSGARGESRELASQYQNELLAFKRMASSPRFKLWVSEMHGEPIEKIVERQMDPANLRVEVQLNGRWVEWTEIETSDMLDQDHE
jgi:protein subunit release factor A